MPTFGLLIRNSVIPMTRQPTLIRQRHEFFVI